MKNNFIFLLCILYIINGDSITSQLSMPDSSEFQIPDQPVFKTQLDIKMDSLFVDDELFDLRMSDAKEIFSEAIISDMTGWIHMWITSWSINYSSNLKEKAVRLNGIRVIEAL